MPDDVEIWSACLAGRESRFSEPADQCMEDIVAGLAPEVTALGDRPLVVFGHSMGAQVGFALCRQMEQVGPSRPVLLVASGHEAPHVYRPGGHHRLPDAELVGHLSSLSGTPAEVLANPDVMALLLPTIRADLKVGETYRPAPGEKLSCAIVTYTGAEDDLDPQKVARWADLTSGPTWARSFPGGHFYLSSSAGAVISSLVADAGTALSGAGLAGAAREVSP